ncbi:Serine/threonine-protein kinase tel1, partial [Coemansia sp. RSA 1836]
AALQAMRDNAKVVITILNVLKVDPLYMWSLIPLRHDKMNRNVSVYVNDTRDNGRTAGISGDPVGGEGDHHMLDHESSGDAAEDENKEAGRSILHVGQRLSATISVEGQVSELIQQATDSGLLSRLFEGWSAWY